MLVRAICPRGVIVEPALEVDDAEFVDMVREAVDEDAGTSDPAFVRAFTRYHDGALDEASDTLLIRFGLEYWGRGVLYVLYTAEDVGGNGALGDGAWIEDLLALAAREKLRVFDELAGTECRLPG